VKYTSPVFTGISGGGRYVTCTGRKTEMKCESIVESKSYV
jgi:hypothetical protein